MDNHIATLERVGACRPSSVSTVGKGKGYGNQPDAELEYMNECHRETRILQEMQRIQDELTRIKAAAIVGPCIQTDRVKKAKVAKRARELARIEAVYAVADEARESALKHRRDAEEKKRLACGIRRENFKRLFLRESA